MTLILDGFNCPCLAHATIKINQLHLIQLCTFDDFHFLSRAQRARCNYIYILAQKGTSLKKVAKQTSLKQIIGQLSFCSNHNETTLQDTQEFVSSFLSFAIYIFLLKLIEDTHALLSPRERWEKLLSKYLMLWSKSKCCKNKTPPSCLEKTLRSITAAKPIFKFQMINLMKYVSINYSKASKNLSTTAAIFNSAAELRQNSPALTTACGQFRNTHPANPARATLHKSQIFQLRKTTT